MVSAVILNYLNPDLTCRCVETLCKAARQSEIETEIIIVDNSAPQTADTLRKRLPDEVIIIENQENCGFSKANNQGIRRATGDLVLIMNNDLFINAEALTKGVEYMTSHANTGVWAPKLTDREGNPQRSCSRFPTLSGVFSEYLLKKQFDNRVSAKAIEADQPVAVDMVIGACMLIPRSVLKEVGGFDEDYFFNVEDVDLCLKIKNRGYKVVFDPRCSAVHLVGASQNSHWYKNRHLHDSRILYFKKHHNAITAGLAKWMIRAGVGLRKVKHEVWGR